jgi:hypothetical protein
MIAGYHLIWTAYGWWLPNDPRGSTSQGKHGNGQQDAVWRRRVGFIFQDHNLLLGWTAA